MNTSTQNMDSQAISTLKNEYFKIQMSGDDFRRLSTFIYNELGIKMPDVKRIMLQSRLQKRLLELKMNTFKEYIDYVFSSEGKNGELIIMIDLVTTNKTDFFREPQHFDFLNRYVLPEFYSSYGENRKLKIWSAGCSTGEEPYTLAMVLQEYVNKHHGYDYEIFATDLSTRVLERAITAVYAEDRISDIPMDVKKRYFLRSKDVKSRTVRVVPELRTKIKFGRLNFMDNQYPVDRDFDIVFCRNVLIYFDRETQQDVINKLASKLKPDGFFFLGHSESITNMNVPLRQVQPTIFRKVG